MKPFIVLLATFAIALAATKFTTGNYNPALAGRIAMAIMLVFTSVAHFAFTKGMMMMLPATIPFKKEIVYVTGVIEIAAAAALLITDLKVITGWVLIGFFICLLPANINAAIKHINYQKGTSDGNGLQYLWFRIPLQVLFIVWTYIFAIYFSK